MLAPERQAQIPGYAVGGLSGGEEKAVFWRMCVRYCYLFGQTRQMFNT